MRDVAVARGGARVEPAPRPWRHLGVLLVLAVACILPFTMSGFRVFQFTQVAMLPVAHTVGDDFRPALRRPVEELTSWDTWGQRP